jgi:hypothetical protein
MVVEIKSTDSAEEIQQKLQAIKNETLRTEQEATEERVKRFEKYFGKWTFEGDPLALQKQWRDEWS